MSQDILLNKFTDFIEISSNKTLLFLESQYADDPKKLAEKKKEHLGYIKQIENDLLEGCCFGFSICHAVMDISGKLDEWNAFLAAIIHWNGKSETLDQKIKIAGQKEEMTLENIFEYVASAVLFNQASLAKSFLFSSDMSQQNLLSPDSHITPPFKNFPEKNHGSYFEWVDKDGKIKTIQKTKTIAGYITKQQLSDRLNEENVSGNICLIHSMEHTVRFGFDKSRGWCVYDPNYDHTKPETAYKSFASKEDMLDEVIHIQGNSLSVQIASFDAEKEIILPILPIDASLLKDSGFCQIVRDTPERLPELLDFVAQSQKADPLRLAFARVLTEKMSNKLTGLNMIMLKSPKMVSKIFKLVDDDPAILSAFCEWFPQKNSKGWTGLHRIIQNAPEKLPELFILVDNHPSLLSVICNTLMERNSAGISSLEMMLKLVPDTFPILFTIATEQNNAILLLLGKYALTQENLKKETVFQLIIDKAPGLLSNLFQLAAKDPLVLFSLSEALIQKYSQNATGWDLLRTKAPQELSRLFELTKQDNSILEIISYAFDQSNPNRSLFAIEMLKHDADQFLKLAKTDERFLLGLIAAFDFEGVACWEILKKENKKSELLDLQEQSPELQKALRKIYPLVISSATSVLQCSSSLFQVRHVQNSPTLEIEEKDKKDTLGLTNGK